MTQTVTAATTLAITTSSSAPTLQQRIASVMQKVLQGKGKGASPLSGGGRNSGGGPLGGGGGPPGGGGGPPGSGGPAAAQQPIAPTADVKAMGSLPQIFTGDRSKADNFIEEVKGYFWLNGDVASYNSPFKKVTFTLTLIKGMEPAQWV